MGFYESFAADLRGMRDCAAALRNELEKHYTPHREQVNRDMIVAGSAPDGRFYELCHLLDRHWLSRFLTTSVLTEHGNATWTFAAAAETIGQRYGDSDGLARARAADVRRLLPGREGA